MTLSVVSSLYKSKVFLDKFLEEIIKAIEYLKIEDYEIIFVNDGSPDDSMEYLLLKKKTIPQITIIDLSRNFGHYNALQIGLKYTKADYVFLIDNDLETPPSFLIECFEALRKDDSLDVVYGYQMKRKGKFVESVGGGLFWWAFNKLSDVEIPRNLLTERLMKKRFVENFLSLGDSNLFILGMFHWTGFNQLGLPVKKGLREGKSTYSLRKRYDLMLQAITSFTGKPLEYLFYSGLLITIASIFISVFLIIQKIIYGDEIQLGWTSIVVINIFILGIISTFLGLIGIYLFKIFRQVQNRPNAIINKIY
ncbi:MAG TPA: glycosyltransferase family 2 protein [Saprospiraceae bacterium]|nr:glycosyltransferase family 2 protein [Saprospiraceae bacterium]